MTGFYKDYQDASDTHENSAEAYADEAQQHSLTAYNWQLAAEQSAQAAADSLAAQEDLEVTDVTFFPSNGILSLTKPNTILSTNLDGRYARRSGADFTGSISIPSLGELRSQGNLNLRFNSEDSNSLATFNLYPDDSDYTALSVNTLGNVFIGGSALHAGAPRSQNKLSVGSMGLVSASEATVGIKANSSYQALAMQANGTNSTVKFNVLDNGNLTVGGAATTNLTLTPSGDLTVTGDIQGRNVAYDGSKLDTIEPSADITDTANVTAAGAAMLTGADFTGNVTTTGTLATGGYTLASTDGTNGQALVTDGSGNVSFGNVVADVSGKADLSGADFTGDISTTGEIKVGESHTNVAPISVKKTSGNTELLELKGYNTEFTIGNEDLTDANGSFYIRTDDDFLFKKLNSVSGDVELMRIKHLNGTDGAHVGINNDNPTEALDVTGNIAVSGTVDGRDVAADGTKLDGLERTVRQRFQRRGYNSTLPINSLTTTFTQVGSTLRINSGATTAVENVLDLNITANFLDINSSNEGEFVITVDAPNPTTETTINLGTVTATAQGLFKVSGDFTKHFSPYCGMSTSSDGSNAFTFANYESWWYDPTTDITTVNFNPYQSNTPIVGDTVYLHPFDWETSGTEIIGETYPIETYNESSTISQNHFHQIYLGYYKPERTFKIKAREITSSENVQITKVAGTYSQIIGG